MAERHEWIPEDLADLNEAVQTLERLGVWGVSVRGIGWRRTEAQVHRRDLISIARLPGVTVEEPRYEAGGWRVSANIGDAAVFALMDAADLPAIGWRLRSAEPVLERLEEVAHDVQPHAS